MIYSIIYSSMMLWGYGVMGQKQAIQRISTSYVNDAYKEIYFDIKLILST